MANETKRVIKDTLMQILDKKSFDNISIKELTDSCDISRNTFYYHYHDIYEVLEDLFDEQTNQHLGNADSWELWEDGILQALNFAITNRRAVYHVYNSLKRENLQRYLSKVMTPITLKFVKQQSQELEVAEEDIQTIVLFYKHGVIGAFGEWLDNNMKGDLEQEIKRLGFMMRGSVRYCLERAAKK